MSYFQRSLNENKRLLLSFGFCIFNFTFALHSISFLANILLVQKKVFTFFIIFYTFAKSSVKAFFEWRIIKNGLDCISTNFRSFLLQKRSKKRKWKWFSIIYIAKFWIVWQRMAFANVKVVLKSLNSANFENDGFRS